MRSVIAMAVKDLLLISRDWLGMFFIIGFPILIGIFFGAMYAGVGTEGTAKLELAVVDDDKSDLSAKFIDALRTGGHVKVTPLTRDEALTRIRRGKLAGMLAIPQGFGDTSGVLWAAGPEIEVAVDPSRQAEAGMLEGLVMQAAGKLMMDRFQDPEGMRQLIQQARDEIAASEDIQAATRPILLQMMVSLDAALSHWAEVRRAERDVEAKTANDRSRDNAEDGFQLARIRKVDVVVQPTPGSTEALLQQLRSKWDISFPQAMLWGVLGASAGFAISIVRERKQGTLLRLQAAPISRGQILFGKALACFVTVVGVIAVMVLVGRLLGMHPRNPLMLAVAAVCVAFTFTGIMVLMSVIGRTEEAVSGGAWLANMVMAMFGGGMIPLAFMPKVMAALSQASPVKWSVLALEGAIWRGFTWSEMFVPCSVLFAFGAVALSLGTYRLSKMSD